MPDLLAVIARRRDAGGSVRGGQANQWRVAAAQPFGSVAMALGKITPDKRSCVWRSRCACSRRSGQVRSGDFRVTPCDGSSGQNPGVAGLVRRCYVLPTPVTGSTDRTSACGQPLFLIRGPCRVMAEVVPRLYHRSSDRRLADERPVWSWRFGASTWMASGWPAMHSVTA
jgi:hypothetical protein